MLRGPIEPSGDVALVLIDDRTIREFGRWPLSRRTVAAAIHSGWRGTVANIVAAAVGVLREGLRRGLREDPSDPEDEFAARTLIGAGELLPIAHEDAPCDLRLPAVDGVARDASREAAGEALGGLPELLPEQDEIRLNAFDIWSVPTEKIL